MKLCHQTETTWEQHTLRAAYQDAIYRRCLDTSIMTLSPGNLWWTMDNGCVTIHLMCDAPAPTSTLQMVHCKCYQCKCQRTNCSCVRAGLPCADLCRCSDCCNSQEPMTSADDDNDPGDESSDEDRFDSFSHIINFVIHFCVLLEIRLLKNVEWWRHH